MYAMDVKDLVVPTLQQNKNRSLCFSDLYIFVVLPEI